MKIAKKIAIKNRDKFLAPLIKLVIENDAQHRLRFEEMNRTQSEVLQNFENLRNQITNKGVLNVSQDEIIVKLYNGLKIYLDTRDISLTPHIALDGVWEPEITKVWTSLIKPNDTIFDVGANFGYFGLLAGHLTDKKKAKVVFFEPNPNLIRYIKKTINLNWYNEQSTIVGAAVSDKKGTVELNILKGYVASSTVQTVSELKDYMQGKMDIELDEAVKVPTITIDEYCETHDIKSIDLMKMDIEGHEDKAYSGMKGIVKSSPDLKLLIEFTKEGYKSPKTFFKQMVSDFGYIATIEADGTLKSAVGKTYEEIIERSDDWTMLVLSKRDLTS